MDEKQFICQNCGCVDHPIKLMKGSFTTELALWYLLIIPGCIYALWRLLTRYDACPRCKKPSMISVDTPTGQQLLSEQKHGKEINKAHEA